MEETKKLIEYTYLCDIGLKVQNGTLYAFNHEHMTETHKALIAQHKDKIIRLLEQEGSK